MRTDRKNSDRGRGALATASALLMYAVLAVLFFGRGLIGNFDGRLVSAGAGRDPSVMIWCLVWWPHALANHLDPFLSRAVWWPSGINLAWITSIPGVAILAWPLTRLAGPVASFNILTLAALPTAAFAAFLLCRHLTGRYWPSILGGFVFGFSPYFLGHLQSHLLLILAFPIPLAALLAIRLLEGDLRAVIFIPLMTLLVVAQIGISLELFATMTAVGAIALALAYAIGEEDWRAAIRGAAVPLCASYAIAAIIAAPYWYYLFAFGMPKGSIISPSGVSSDLLNFFIPTGANLAGANSLFEAVASRFTFRPEAGAWIAWPLLAIVAWYVRSRWRTAVGKVLIIILGAIWIATLGPRLHVGGHTMFGLPWKIIEHLPFLKSALPARLTMYGFLIIAVMTATMFASLEPSRELSRPLKYSLAGAIALFMIPNLRASFWNTPIDLPNFFADGSYRNYLQKGETVVALPYGNRGNSMLWQGSSGMYFNMAGGYTGPAIVDEFQKWPAVNALYWGSEIPDGELQLGAFLAAHDVRHIIVEQSRAAELRPILACLEKLNLTPIETGGVLVYRTAPDAIAKYRGANLLELEQRYDRSRFDRLVIAAEKYLSSGGKIRELTPLRAARIGLLPSSWAVDQDVYTKDGLIMGPWKDDQVIIGVVGAYDSLKPLIETYRADSLEVYFPYPRALTVSPKGNTFMRKLVMVFDLQGLDKAARRASSEMHENGTAVPTSAR